MVSLLAVTEGLNKPVLALLKSVLVISPVIEDTLAVVPVLAQLSEALTTKFTTAEH